MGKRLAQKYYSQDTTFLAQNLLGKILCHRPAKGPLLKGRIVETEAYLGPTDPACHTFGGRQTKRVQSMYLRGGHSYIYLIYGMHFCFNIVTRTEKEPEAVLIRAVEPLLGRDSLTHRLNRVQAPMQTNGPGKLCRYLGLNRSHDGLALWRSDSAVWIESADTLLPEAIVRRPRVGVDYAGAASKWPLRFYVKGSPYVSKK